jgi:hypothetical protein
VISSEQSVEENIWTENGGRRIQWRSFVNMVMNLRVP